MTLSGALLLGFVVFVVAIAAYELFDRRAGR